MKIFDNEMSLDEAGLFAFILSHIDENNYVNMSCAEIAEKIGKSKSWTYKHLHNLDKKSLIWFEKDANNLNENNKIFCYYKSELKFPF